MAKEFAISFYKGKGWLKCRASFIAIRITIDGGACERCHDEPGYIVDHIIELTPDNINNPDISLNHSNLQYLCLACHNKKTFGRKHDVIRDGLMFDCNGDLIQSPPIK